MKCRFLIVGILIWYQGSTQVVPNVSLDTLLTRMIPIYFDALKSGIYDLPRDTAWLSTTKYESEGISFEIPEKWLNLGSLGSVVEIAFDASGLYFPDSFNDKPILAGFFLLNQRGRSLEEVKDSALKDYRTNTDRVFEANYLDSAYNYKLANGSKGYVLHTRFSRKSNQLNQSRYDLILFSEKLKKGFSVMVSVQYADPTYAFEKMNLLDAFAARLFNRVILK